MNHKLQEALASNRGIVENKENVLVPDEFKNSITKKFNEAKTLLMIPILLFEILVCYLGYQFYKSIGFDNFTAFSLSFATECFYMYFSSKRGITNLIIRILFLSVSIFTLSYNAYNKDINLIEYKNNNIKKGTIITDRLKAITDEFDTIKAERNLINKEMQVFIENEMITRGNSVLKERRKNLNIRFEKLTNEKNKLELKFENYSSKGSNLSIIEQFSILTVRTMIMILVFSLIQIAICISLPDVIDSLKRSLGINSTDNI